MYKSVTFVQYIVFIIYMVKKGREESKVVKERWRERTKTVRMLEEEL